MLLNLAGILPPVATPFVDDEVDVGAMRANCERWMRTGLRGVVLLGTNGEAPLIRDEEAVRLVDAAREAVPADRVLLVGTGRQATRDVIALSRAVARVGADAVLVLTPSVYRNQLTPAALIAHYHAIADGSPVPVVLYNMPQATGVTLTPAIVEELAAHPNIAGIKESSGDVAVVGELVVARCRPASPSSSAPRPRSTPACWSAPPAASSPSPTSSPICACGSTSWPAPAGTTTRCRCSGPWPRSPRR